MTEEGNRAADGWMIELPPRGVTKAVDKLLVFDDIRREEASVDAVGRNFMVAAVE